MPNEPLTIERAADDVVALVLSGDHDLATAPALRDRLAEAIDGGHPVLVELSTVSFLDSTVLGALMGGLRRARERGQGFALVIAEETDPSVKRVFELTGLFRAFPVYASRAEALAALGVASA